MKREERECVCGRTFEPFYSTADWQSDDDGTATPYGPELFCTHCKENRRRAEEAAKAVEAERRKLLLAMPRPRLGEPYRQEWIDARKPEEWRPARRRNRCVRCGRRAAQRSPIMCRRCTESHKRFLEEFSPVEAKDKTSPTGPF